MKTPKLKIAYDGRVVLNVPELEFEKGKVYALIGANGSGKTTFGKNCGFSYQPQKPYAFRMSVLKNLMLTGASEDEAKEMLAALKLTEFKDARADKLSGGETAKMVLARSIVILITHSMRQAQRIADKTLFLKTGELNENRADLKEFLDYYA